MANSIREQWLLEAALKGKYAPLFRHLNNLGDDEWRASFAEIERVLDRSLPRSARMYRPWWANTKDGGHSQALAWVLAGWTTSQVDLDAEEVTFIRERKDDLMSRDTIERKSAPTMEEFRAALTSEIERAISNDQSIVSINAGELHRKVGGYPTPFNRMQMCCNAMYAERRPSDRIVSSPPKRFGASLTIAYRLPRY